MPIPGNHIYKNQFVSMHYDWTHLLMVAFAGWRAGGAGWDGVGRDGTGWVGGWIVVPPPQPPPPPLPPPTTAPSTIRAPPPTSPRFNTHHYSIEHMNERTYSVTCNK